MGFLRLMNLYSLILVTVSLLLLGPDSCRPLGPAVPSPEQMKACSSFTPQLGEQTSPIRPYWASGTFAEDLELDRFVQSWFSAQLCAMGEGRLLPNEHDGTTIRFLWLRTFHPGVAIRVEQSPREIRLLAIELDGAGGYEPGHVALRREALLEAEQWREILETIHSANLWSLPTSDHSVQGLDGSHWVIEIAEKSRRHVVQRWSGQELEEIGRLLIGLSGLEPDEIY